jgi:hypothetical protein
MKSSFLPLALMCISICCCYAQTPQIAVVKPNGVTTIHSTWAQSYDAASNGDFIYLPGSIIMGNIVIDKAIHVFGAGIHPDSSSATGRTIILSVGVNSGASGGSISGIEVQGGIVLGGGGKLTNYLVKRCIAQNITFYASSPTDSITENCSIIECVFQYANSIFYPNLAKNNLFLKNIITSHIENLSQCTFNNNIFIYPNNNPVIKTYVSECLFQNNVFTQLNPTNGGNAGYCYNSFFNNLKLGTAIFEDNQNCPNQAESGNLSVMTMDAIFINYTTDNNYFNDNFNLDLSCPGNNAGTDGTDLGIYGTNNPTPPGWLPSNPHIYFKQIDAETGPDGKLHIQVGVRTQDD